MVDISTRIWAVRAAMVDGAAVDLLLFFNQVHAEEYAEYVRSCGSLGWSKVAVVERQVIGKNEPTFRPKKDRRTR